MEEYFNDLLHDATLNVVMITMAIVFILSVASAVYIWYEWKER